MSEELVDYSTCTPDQREIALDGLREHANALHLELLRVVAAADAAGDHRADGACSMADWLAFRYQLSGRTARTWVRAAHALDEMPRLRAAYASGTISFEQLTEVLTFARPVDDAWLAEALPTLGFAQVEAMAKQRRRIRAAERDDARRRRHLRLRPDASGLGSRLSGFLPTEDAAIIEAALDRRAEAIGPDAETGTWRPHEHRMVDGLRDLCAEELAVRAKSSSAPDACVVVVHAPAAILRGDGTAGSATIGGRPIHDESLRRLLCDARVEVHADDPDGRTVGIGRASRTPPHWLRRRVTHRDQHHCRWPGCSRPIRHLHHMQHWTNGGATDATNLIGLCWHHHHLLHEGGWNATGDADGTITLMSPFGRTITARAGPVAA